METLSPSPSSRYSYADDDFEEESDAEENTTSDPESVHSAATTMTDDNNDNNDDDVDQRSSPPAPDSLDVSREKPFARDISAVLPPSVHIIDELSSTLDDTPDERTDDASESENMTRPGDIINTDTTENTEHDDKHRRSAQQEREKHDQPSAQTNPFSNERSTTYPEAEAPNPLPGSTLTGVEAQLRKVIHEAVSSQDVQSKIRDCTMRVLQSQRDDRQPQLSFHDDQLMEELLRDGLVELVKTQVAAGLSGLGSSTAFAQPERHDDCVTIELDIIQGKAFLEHVDVSQLDFPPHRAPKFVLHAFFQGQRRSSKPIACCVDPIFDTKFVFTVNKSDDERKHVNSDSPFAVTEPIHIVLVRIEPEGQQVLVSSHKLRWQEHALTLTTPYDTKKRIAAVEMGGVGTSSSVAAGVLHVSLRVLMPGSKPWGTSREEHTEAVARVSSLRNDATRCEKLFLLYAKQWWKEFLEIRTGHNFRLVKIFVADECGHKRLITLTVKPITPGRLLNTPQHAARFVSLLSCEKLNSVGVGKIDQWSDPFSFLCVRVGQPEDHASLLCSLLLGFGMDAYVCVGTKSVRRRDGGQQSIAYAWVLTFAAKNVVHFWNPLSGERWLHGCKHTDYPPQRSVFDTVGCVFNNKSFFANIQPSDFVDECSFSISNQSNWKAMSHDAIKSITLSNPPDSGPPLLSNNLNLTTTASTLEVQLRAAISQHRRTLGLGVNWNLALSPILVQCLSAFEIEKSTGTNRDNISEDFQHSIKRAIPKGHTFKGYPIQFNHCSSNIIMVECLRDNLCREIMAARGDQVLHSAHVKIFSYPDNTVAVWLMLSVTYRSVL